MSEGKAISVAVPLAQRGRMLLGGGSDNEETDLGELWQYKE